MKELLDIFNRKTSEGPIYVCTCCHQLWFKHCVYNVNEIHFKTENEKATFHICRTKFVSRDGKEWICKTCRTSVKGAKIPKLSIKNKMGFPPLPPELQLYSMEERLIAMRIVFMLLRDHPVGGQTFVRGNFVNVPVDIAPTVNTLPRCLNESEIVTIKFKRKIQYKRCEFKENIRPMAVWKALSYLLKESPLYKEANIQVDTSWLDNMYNLIDDDRELVTQSTHNDSDFEIENKNEKDNDENQIHSSEKETICHRPHKDECEHNRMSDDEGISFTEENEDNLETCAIDMDTMIDL